MAPWGSKMSVSGDANARPPWHPRHAASTNFHQAKTHSTRSVYQRTRPAEMRSGPSAKQTRPTRRKETSEQTQCNVIPRYETKIYERPGACSVLRWRFKSSRISLLRRDGPFFGSVPFLLPVRVFWEFLHFLNSFYFIYFLFLNNYN